MRANLSTIKNPLYRIMLLPAALLLLLGFFLLPATALAKEKIPEKTDAPNYASGTAGATQNTNPKDPLFQLSPGPSSSLENETPLSADSSSAPKAGSSQPAANGSPATADRADQTPPKGSQSPSATQSGQGSSPLPGLKMPESTQDETYKLNQQNPAPQNQPATPSAAPELPAKQASAKTPALNLNSASPQETPSPIRKFFSSFEGPNIGAWISNTNPSPYTSENFNPQTTRILYISAALLILTGLAFAGRTLGKRQAAEQGLYEPKPPKSGMKITPAEN